MSIRGTVSEGAAHLDVSGCRSDRPIFVRYATRRPALLAVSLISGFIFGIAYRHLMDPAAERDIANYLRSGVHGVGIALAA
jgi:hypothetical protein